MTSPAQTARSFGGYLIALAVVLILAPNLFLQAFGIALPVLLVFAIVDAAAAIWTWMALKRIRHDPPMPTST